MEFEPVIGLEVHAFEIDAARLTVGGDLDPAAFDQGQVVLRDLVTLDQVGVRIVLAVELGGVWDLAIQRESSHDGQLDCPAVDDRQDAGHAQADRADVAVRRGASVLARAAAEHFAHGQQLGVNLKPDDRFILCWRTHDGHLLFSHSQPLRAGAHYQE